jgi:V8-like Glu-specific endopeptidase
MDLKPRAGKKVLQAAAGLLLVSFATPAKAEVIGQDDRIIPSYSWLIANQRQPIGRLEVQQADGSYTTCSFTVVGRNIGLTNSHCLMDEAGRGARQIKAFALQYGAQAYASANVDVYWTGMSTPPTTFGERAKDWAIIRFNQDLGSNSTGWFGNESFSFNLNEAGNSVKGSISNLIGYSGGGTTPTGHFNCGLLWMNSGSLMHTCDALGGASGSSLHTDGRLVQALHWGSFEIEGVRINGAVPLERFMPAVLKLRENGGQRDTIVPTP